MAQTVKNPPANAGDVGLIPGSRRSPGEGNGNPLRYSCLENPMDRGAWRATVHGVPKSQTHTIREGRGCREEGGAAKKHQCSLGAGSCSKRSAQFNSVAQSCPTLFNPSDCSTRGFPVHHQLPGLTQTYVHKVGDAIQPSHPLLSPFPPAFNFSQHQGLF